MARVYKKPVPSDKPSNSLEEVTERSLSYKWMTTPTTLQLVSEVAVSVALSDAKTEIDKHAGLEGFLDNMCGLIVHMLLEAMEDQVTITKAMSDPQPFDMSLQFALDRESAKRILGWFADGDVKGQAATDIDKRLTELIQKISESEANAKLASAKLTPKDVAYASSFLVLLQSAKKSGTDILDATGKWIDYLSAQKDAKEHVEAGGKLQ